MVVKRGNFRKWPQKTAYSMHSVICDMVEYNLTLNRFEISARTLVLGSWWLPKEAWKSFACCLVCRSKRGPLSLNVLPKISQSHSIAGLRAPLSTLVASPLSLLFHLSCYKQLQEEPGGTRQSFKYLQMSHSSIRIRSCVM